jgi:hypothetical protein
MKWLDKIDWKILIVIALMLGLAPFQPSPHLFVKFNMLMQGTLTQPMDIFDLLMHGAPSILVLIKAARQFIFKR